MSSAINLPRNERIKIPRPSKQNKNKLDKIVREYCLKRNSFNPRRPSPNIFMGKLEIRMKKYYNNLYNSDNCAKK